MHEHSPQIDLRGLPKILLVGNPNVGKSVIFSHLTGRYVTVSNYPGTTVSLTRGAGKFGDKQYEIIDTPGIYSLLPHSEDEQVTATVVLKEQPYQIVQVGDAKNLERTLLVTIQLLERGVPVILNLNMIDEAEQLRYTIDFASLGERLGISVIPTSAVEGRGVGLLKKELVKEPVASSSRVTYHPEIEKAIGELTLLLPVGSAAPRYVALQILCGDEQVSGWVRQKLNEAIWSQVEAITEKAQKNFSMELIHVITRQRQKKVQEILNGVVSRDAETPALSKSLGEAMMRPLTGFPILVLVLMALYQIVGVWAAGDAVGFLEDTVFGKYIIPGTAWVLSRVLPFPIVQEFLVGEYGAISMGLTYAFAIVFPIVTAFFIFFGMLEDSGYLPRLAILMNRGFRVIGLNGKAIIPMVLGLGCDTMATMTTRTLDSRKERAIAILLLALAVPCSAQLGVLLGMLGQISALGAWIWGGVVVGVFVLVGWLASLIIPGKSSDFIIEVPPLRFPKIGNIVQKTLARVEWYLKEAAPLFVIGTVILFALDKTGMLGVIEQMASPVITGFLGLPAKATEAFLVGFLRRDYGAAGLYQLSRNGMLDGVQVVVSLTTITLFIPCIANFMMMIKEQGLKRALYMAAFIVPFSFGVGGVLNLVLRRFAIVL